MRSDDAVIVVDNLSKTYRLFKHPGDRVKEFLSLGLKRYHHDFVALRNISFEIKRGDTVGIIGRNGAGKSTLLQLVCGVLKPTTGSVRVQGRISALLELGTGFNADFTGRENVFFQGAVMGFTRSDMEKRLEEITEFADIGEHIDQPVRTYSSGMFLRLAFAVAVHVDPEILVVDEALSTGDAAFQDKCLRRMEVIRSGGCTILFVSHSAGQIARFCKRALLLDHGQLLCDGPVSRTLSLYVNGLDGLRHQNTASPIDNLSDSMDGLSQRPYYNEAEIRLGDRAATILDARMIQEGAENPGSFAPGQRTRLLLNIRFHLAVDRPVYEFSLKTAHGAMLFGTNTLELGAADAAQTPDSDALVCFDFDPFLDAGEYAISIGVSGQTPAGLVTHDRRYDSIHFHVASPLASDGRLALNAAFHRLDGPGRQAKAESA